MTEYLDIVEERDGYRARLEYDDSPEKPYDDGATPIFTVTDGYIAEPFNKQAEPYEHAVTEILARHDLETLERFVKIFYGADHLDSFWSDGIRGRYVAFDTAEWRETVGAPPALLANEYYLSEVQAWAEGDVFGHIIEKYSAEDDDWEEVEDGTCWGFYGRKYAEQAACEALTAAIEWDKAHPEPVAVVSNSLEAMQAEAARRKEAASQYSYREGELSRVDDGEVFSAQLASDTGCTERLDITATEFEQIKAVLLDYRNK